MLRHGPTQRGPSCLTPLLPLLRSQFVPVSLLPIYSAAWLLVRVVTESRGDGDTLLGRIALDGALESALKSSVWRPHNFEVSGRSSNIPLSTW
jgi:hypothetical protein